jgi:hypothetical protein
MVALFIRHDNDMRPWRRLSSKPVVSTRWLRVAGWEEWDLDADSKIIASCGCFDAADYEHQTTAS